MKLFNELYEDWIVFEYPKSFEYPNLSMYGKHVNFSNNNINNICSNKYKEYNLWDRIKSTTNFGYVCYAKRLGERIIEQVNEDLIPQRKIIKFNVPENVYSIINVNLFEYRLSKKYSRRKYLEHHGQMVVYKPRKRCTKRNKRNKRAKPGHDRSLCNNYIPSHII